MIAAEHKTMKNNGKLSDCPSFPRRPGFLVTRFFHTRTRFPVMFASFECSHRRGQEAQGAFSDTAATE
jgi:hypothetical protein